MSTDLIDPVRVRRIRIALLVGALAQFALLYAPQPVLPQMAGAFGLTPGVVALLVSASTLGLAVAALPLGTLSQVVGRRRVMVTSLLIAEVLGLLLPLVPSFSLMVVVRLVQGAAVAGLAAVAAAYLADETGGRQLGTTMGLYVAGTTIGGMSGRLLGGIAGDYLGWTGGLATVAVMSGICTVLFLVLLPVEQRHVRQEFEWGPLLRGVRAAVADRSLYPPYLVAALGMGSFVAIYNVLGFRLTAPPLLVAPALAALVFLAYAAGTVSSAIAGRLADRFGRSPVLLCGLALTVAGLLVMLSDDIVLIVAGLIVFTGGFFVAHSVASGWVGADAQPWFRGQASALYQFCYYGGSSVGGVLGGAAYHAWGWSGMTALLCAWLVIAAASVWFGARRGKIVAARSETEEPAQVASGS